MTRHANSLRMWLLQRISAVYLAVYGVGVAVYLAFNPVADYAAWQAWLASPLASVTAAGCVLSLVVHGWVGLRDVVLDYVQPLGLRLLVLALTGFFIIGTGFWAIRILIMASG